MSSRILNNILNFFDDKRKCLKHYLFDCKIREVIERMEEFGKNKLVLIYDIDEYVQEKKIMKREIRVILVKLMAYIHLYKMFFMGFVDDIRIRLLIMDYTLNGSERNRLLYSLATISLGLFFLFLLFLFQYLEINRKLPIFKIFHQIKYRIIKYPLNSKNYKKFCFYFKIMCLTFDKYYMNTYSIIATILHMFIFGSYPKYGFEIYSILSQILGNITYLISSYYAVAYLNVGFTIWMSATLYLKYKFEEINTKIELSLKQMNIRLLMNAIHEHNYVERLTRDINSLFSKIIFLSYYMFTLTSQLFLFLISYLLKEKIPCLFTR